MTNTVSRSRKPKPEQAPPSLTDDTMISPAADPATMPPPPPDTMTGAMVSTATMDVTAPLPPQLDMAGVSAPAAAGWVYGRVITHLWSYDASTGVWAWVDGIGWKRLSPNSEFGHSHMALLATMATNGNLTVDYHEDASGRIDQVLA
jgi:hypothetical protein